MIFVDTWAWIALADRRDPYHTAAAAQHADFSKRGERYATSDAILSETTTALFRSVPFDQARRFIERIFEAADAGHYDLLHIDPPLFRKAWELRLRYTDKPAISFVDLTSMAAMQEHGITDIFTGDAHFTRVGLGFRLHSVRRP